MGFDPNTLKQSKICAHTGRLSRRCPGAAALPLPTMLYAFIACAQPLTTIFSQSYSLLTLLYS